MEIVSSNPVVIIYDDILSSYECDYIIKIAKDRMERSRVDADEGRIESTIRTSSQAWIQPFHDLTVQDVSKRISSIVSVDLKNVEDIQVVHYSVSQEYQAHFDAYDVSTKAGKRAVTSAGQRIFTALIYLNDVEKGGETDFPNLGITVEPKKGRMVVFSNIDAANSLVPHTLSLHAALPVEEGEKWACNFWFHENQYNSYEQL